MIAVTILLEREENGRTKLYNSQVFVDGDDWRYVPAVVKTGNGDHYYRGTDDTMYEGQPTPIYKLVPEVPFGPCVG